MTTILSSCSIPGDWSIAAGDGTDVDTDGISMVNPPAWVVGNIGQLYLRGDVRGADKLMPGADGVRPYRRRPTVTTYAIPLVIAGDFDYTLDEDCPADPWVAFQHNLDYLLDNLVAPPGTRQGTRESLLVMPDGSERRADIHVLRITGRVESATLTGALQISIPDSQFAEVVS